MPACNRILVLCYHAVSDRWPDPGAVRPRVLERQLEWLVSQRFTGATFHDAVVSPPSGKVLAVTFDDGYRSILEHAVPILSRLGLPGTIFVPTDFIGARRPLAWAGLERWAAGPHAHELAPLSWPELRELAQAGWEIGSHSCTHVDLTRADAASLAAELVRSREACAEGVGAPCRSIAYPYGAADDRACRAARDGGYVAGGLLRWRLPPPQPLAWPRIGIFRTDGFLGFRVKVSSFVRHLREPSAWDVLQARVDAIRTRQHTRNAGNS
jgi:peptidoglycan/xylan/chitin deacetylase (PgdA/CDA1 family)